MALAGVVLGDTIRAFSLTAISILFLLPSCLVAAIGYITLWLLGRLPTPKRQNVGTRRTILVTGVGMAKGLTLARAFYLFGHRVVGADFEEKDRIPSPGRYSCSLSSFHKLFKPATPDKAEAYTRRLVEIVQAERVDLWVSCSGVASAVEDARAQEAIERDTSCKCIQFDIETTWNLHEKDAFMRACDRTGLPAPETHHVTSSRDVLRILSQSQQKHPKRKFILKPIGMDDVNRGNMTLFPLSTLAETETYISHMPISSSKPWILQQFIPGGEEYCTHALVVRGEVKCFVACPSSELLMYYEPLPPASGLSRAMLEFTREFAERFGDPAKMTGHLSFDFMVTDEEVNEKGLQRRIYAIECNPRAHTAVTLFGQVGREMEAMVRAYLSALDTEQHPKITNGTTTVRGRVNGIADNVVRPTPNALPRYWLGHDLITLVLFPAARLVSGQLGIRDFVGCNWTFLNHVFSWKEGTIELWDSMPAVALYHEYWPFTIMNAWWHGKQWSRINVSTLKMFAR